MRTWGCGGSVAQMTNRDCGVCVGRRFMWNLLKSRYMPWRSSVKSQCSSEVVRCTSWCSFLEALAGNLSLYPSVRQGKGEKCNPARKLLSSPMTHCDKTVDGG